MAAIPPKRWQISTIETFALSLINSRRAWQYLVPTLTFWACGQKPVKPEDGKPHAPPLRYRGARAKAHLLTPPPVKSRGDGGRGWNPAAAVLAVSKGRKAGNTNKEAVWTIQDFTQFTTPCAPRS